MYWQSFKLLLCVISVTTEVPTTVFETTELNSNSSDEGFYNSSDLYDVTTDYSVMTTTEVPWLYVHESFEHEKCAINASCKTCMQRFGTPEGRRNISDISY